MKKVLAQFKLQVTNVSKYNFNQFYENNLYQFNILW